jgi:hypothetical protein
MILNQTTCTARQQIRHGSPSSLPIIYNDSHNFFCNPSKQSGQSESEETLKKEPLVIPITVSYLFIPTSVCKYLDRLAVRHDSSKNICDNNHRVHLSIEQNTSHLRY